MPNCNVDINTLKSLFDEDNIDYKEDGGTIKFHKKNVATITMYAGLYNPDETYVELKRKSEYGGYPIIDPDNREFTDRYHNPLFEDYEQLKQFIADELNKPPVKTTKSRNAENKKALIQNIFGTMLKKKGGRIKSYADDNEKLTCKVSMSNISVELGVDSVSVRGYSHNNIDIADCSFDPEKMINTLAELNDLLYRGIFDES
jgi:hypothetical protein